MHLEQYTPIEMVALSYPNGHTNACVKAGPAIAFAFYEECSLLENTTNVLGESAMPSALRSLFPLRRRAGNPSDTRWIDTNPNRLLRFVDRRWRGGNP